ncbi:non-classical arabinogalactan protein 30-like [Hordeum vulgare]|nr:non-classical arabinogalactan protein 30-like [Hordeum vulgare]
MALLARCLLVCLAIVVLSLGCLPGSGSAMGLPRPRPNLNFTIGVEGAVWCKGCRYAGYVQSRNASPLPNAPALLRCRRGEWALSVWGATDERGYFQIQTAQQSAPFTSKDCKVYVLGSPARACGVPVKPRGNDDKGSPLKFRKFVTLPDGLQAVYTAGDFVFGPKKPGKC